MCFGLYAGGFLGPFGRAILAVLIPQLRDAFDASTADVTWAITAYLVPFAALQLVSGTIGERVGIARTARVAYVAYVALSVLAAFVPLIEVFVAARALQGAADAFLTPLLLAAVAVSARRGRWAARSHLRRRADDGARRLAADRRARGRDLVAAGLPRAAVAALASPRPRSPARASAQADPPRLRTALTLRSAGREPPRPGYLSIAGLGFLVALRVAHAFGLGSTERGALVVSFGLAGALVGRWAGESPTAAAA